MVEPIVPSQVAIGACLNCRQLFLITPDTETCYLCGRLPAYALPFPVVVSSAHPELVEGTAILPPAAPPTLIGITCPHCHSNVQLSISDSEISVVPPPVPVADEEPAGPDPKLSYRSELEEAGSALSDSEYLDQVAGLEPLPAAEDRTSVLSP